MLALREKYTESQIEEIADEFFKKLDDMENKSSEDTLNILE